MPLFHVFAMATCLHLAACCGGRLVIVPGHRPETVLDLIAAEKITRFTQVRRSLSACSITKSRQRIFLVAHGLFRIGAASGGDFAR
jgi:acyl-CoA synthetase (AMP-forming)/AMP-acid ligase II